METDGPIPGLFSLLSVGVSCVGSFDGDRFVRRDPQRDTFYCELRPVSARFDPEAMAVNGLDRDALAVDGEDPYEAMPRLAAWVRSLAAGHKAVFVAYPLSFDWLWTYTYLVTYGDQPGAIANSPFGFSGALDMKTLYAAAAGAPIAAAGKKHMPAALLPSAPHTHNALDDAVEQGELFCNLMEHSAHVRALAAAARGH